MIPIHQLSARTEDAPAIRVLSHNSHMVPPPHSPYLDHSLSCGAIWHQPGRSQVFAEPVFWEEKTKKERVVDLGMEDVIGRLKVVQKEFDRWGSATYMHHDCRMAARRGLGERVRRVEESLPNYFE